METSKADHPDKKESINIVIAEDHNLYLEGFMALLKQFPDLQIIAGANSGTELITLLETCKPAIVILDIKTTGMNALHVIKTIDQKMPWIRIISLLSNSHPFYMREMLKYGTKGFLSKNSSAQELVECIRNVYSGKTFFCQQSASALLQDIIPEYSENEPNYRNITTREIELITFLASGYSTKEISGKLFISPKTVERHKTNILAKLKVKNTAQLVRIAVENGLLSP